MTRSLFPPANSSPSLAPLAFCHPYFHAQAKHAQNMECLINLISVNGWPFCEYVYLKLKTIELIRQGRFTFDTFVSLLEFYVPYSYKETHLLVDKFSQISLSKMLEENYFFTCHLKNKAHTKIRVFCLTSRLWSVLFPRVNHLLF